MNEEIALYDIVRSAVETLQRLSKDFPLRFVVLDTLMLLAFMEDHKMKERVPFGFPEDLRIISNPVFLIVAGLDQEIFQELNAHEPLDTIEVTQNIINSFG